MNAASYLAELLPEVRYLLDVFIEGGYAEEEDVPHLDRLFALLQVQPFAAKAGQEDA